MTFKTTLRMRLAVWLRVLASRLDRAATIFLVPISKDPAERKIMADIMARARNKVRQEFNSEIAALNEERKLKQVRPDLFEGIKS